MSASNRVGGPEGPWAQKQEKTLFNLQWLEWCEDIVICNLNPTDRIFNLLLKICICSSSSGEPRCSVQHIYTRSCLTRGLKTEKQRGNIEWYAENMASSPQRDLFQPGQRLTPHSLFCFPLGLLTSFLTPATMPPSFLESSPIHWGNTKGKDHTGPTL